MRQMPTDRAAFSQLVDLNPTAPPFTAQQTAMLLNVSVDAVYDAVASGEIRALRLGRAIRVPRREISRLLGLEPDPA